MLSARPARRDGTRGALARRRYHHGARRDLLVDGEAEASTGGAARRTEELLATLPLVLHPDPKHLLEVGLGSGITLGTAARFDLERIDCVEIAAPVLEAAKFFAPDNRGIAGGADPRVRIRRGDGRLELTRHRDAYDVVIANTVHSWSVGSTGLYSREYFARIAGALRADGLAVQWLPVEQIGGESLAAILATFFSVLPLRESRIGTPVSARDLGGLSGEIALPLALARSAISGAHPKRQRVPEQRNTSVVPKLPIRE